MVHRAALQTGTFWSVNGFSPIEEAEFGGQEVSRAVGCSDAADVLGCMRYDDAGQALGEPPNRLRYATTTGTLMLRWEGARRPTIWTVPRPKISAADARLELTRRFLHVFGPSTPASFAEWAGIGPGQGRAAFDALAGELMAVDTPIGPGWMLNDDEGSIARAEAESSPAAARLLPSGDPYYLLQRADRELLVPDPRFRRLLWTPRVWPGALLVDGEIVGTWRRANANVIVEPWRRLAASETHAVETEASGLPLPGLEGQVRVT